MMQKTYTLTELKENKELLVEFKAKVKAEGIRTPYWNLSEDKFRSMYSSVMYMAEFAEKIESGQSDIEEVIETKVKKKPDTGNLISYFTIAGGIELPEHILKLFKHVQDQKLHNKWTKDGYEYDTATNTIKKK